jgi:hypothetical protein
MHRWINSISAIRNYSSSTVAIRFARESDLLSTCRTARAADGQQRAEEAWLGSGGRPWPRLRVEAPAPLCDCGLEGSPSAIPHSWSPEKINIPSHYSCRHQSWWGFWTQSFPTFPSEGATAPPSGSTAAKLQRGPQDAGHLSILLLKAQGGLWPWLRPPTQPPSSPPIGWLVSVRTLRRGAGLTHGASKSSA